MINNRDSRKKEKNGKNHADQTITICLQNDRAMLVIVYVYAC